jgi:hypothetical protein
MPATPAAAIAAEVAGSAIKMRYHDKRNQMTFRRPGAIVTAASLVLAVGACSSDYGNGNLSPYYSHPAAGGSYGTSLSPSIVPNSNEPANDQEVDPTKENYGSGSRHR